MSTVEPGCQTSVLEEQLFEPGVLEGADCILTERQFRKRYGVVLESSSSAEEEDEEI